MAMTDELVSSSPPITPTCPACGSEVAPNLLSCPSCHRLVHADRLKELAGPAEASERAGDPSGALGVLARGDHLAPGREPPARGHRRPDRAP